MILPFLFFLFLFLFWLRRKRRREGMSMQGAPPPPPPPPLVCRIGNERKSYSIRAHRGFPNLFFLYSILILSLRDAFFLASSTQQLSPNKNVQTCCFSPLPFFCPGWFLLFVSFSYAGKGRMMYAMAINAPFVFRGGRRPPNREALFHTTHTARTTLTTSRMQAMCAI